MDMNLVNKQNLNNLEHPDFALNGREERNARVNEGTFKIGGGAIKSASQYELSGKHSLLSQKDIINRPLDFSRANYGRHDART
jgi:hypothetical protein